MIQRGKVLIVEDNTMVAEYVASVLEARGFMPVHAISLSQARQRLAQEAPFTLCVCDRWLPDGEGCTLLADLGTTPAIVMSALLEDEDREHLRTVGFVDVLLKPCSPEVLERSALTALSTPAASATASTTTAVTDHDVAGDPPVLDDATALRMSGGDHEVMHRLRTLLLTELPAMRKLLLDAIDHDDRRSQLAGELHKLAASAGWCGASELTVRCEALRRSVLHGDAFTRKATAMLTALDRLQQQLGPTPG